MRRPAPEPGSLQDYVHRLVSHVFSMVLVSVISFLLCVIYDRFIAPWLWKPPKVTLCSTSGRMAIKLGKDGSPIASGTLECPSMVLAQHAESALADRRLVPGPEPKSTLRIVGELDTGDWSTVEGFKLLGRILRMLNKDILYAQWEDLKLRLLNLPIDCSVLPTVRFAGFEPLPPLENLKTLTWSGHRRQLTDSWMPFTLDLLQSLTILDITCDITIGDCFYLLLHCKKVTTFTLKTIVKGKVNKSDASGIESVFAADPEPCAKKGGIRRPHLRSLTLTSFQDIAPLLHPFNFTSLRGIDFNLSYDHSESFQAIEKSIPWHKLTKVHLRGRIQSDNFGWVRGECPGADHQHAYVKETQ